MTTFEMPHLWLAGPEIWLLAMACVVLVVDLFVNDPDRKAAYLLSQLTLAGAVYAAIHGQWGVQEIGFSGTYIADSMAVVMKVAMAVLTFLAFAYSRDYLRDRNLMKSEFYVLGLFALLGMFVMASAHSMLTMYLGLELLSLCLYAMVAIDRDSKIGSEAAMKYFVLGALASGMLLYGMSMVYGATGSLDLGQIAQAAGQSGDPLLLVFGLTFILVGVAFKFGAVPFHMWIPDVYEGAPTPVTLFIGSGPKVAAVALFMRLIAEGLGPLMGHWQAMVSVLAVLSLGVGNIFALVQTNIKRMLAYSTISHVGFILLGLIAGTTDGYSAALFYAVTYGLMAAGAFGVVILLGRKGFEADRIEDLRGLNDRSPLFAFVMLVLMFSMTGVPGTVGFYAKWLVLQSVVDVNMVWLAIVAVVFAAIGAFYYLRVLKVVYFDRAEAETPALVASGGFRTVLALNGLAVLGLGIFPGYLIAVCVAAVG